MFYCGSSAVQLMRRCKAHQHEEYNKPGLVSSLWLTSPKAGSKIPTLAEAVSMFLEPESQLQ